MSIFPATKLGTSEIIELPGMAKMHGSDMMREEHWDWKGIDKVLPQAAWLLKTQEGEAASILRIFLRMLKSERRVLRAVGIGGVWTRPDLRGQGYGTILLDKAMDKIRAEQPSGDVVILYTERYTGFYAHLGFVPIEDGLYATPIHSDLLIAEKREWKVNPEGHF